MLHEYVLEHLRISAKMMNMRFGTSRYRPEHIISTILPMQL